MSAPRPVRPADRYGDRAVPRNRRLSIGLGVAAVALAVGLAGWVALLQARNPVGWSEVTVRVLDDARTEVRYTVSAPPGQVVVCTVRALNDGRAVVGQLDVRAGPSTQPTFAVATTLATTERAAGAEVRACAVA